jgi:hypothetical protein
MVAPVVALLVGAGVATGAYALIDDGNSATQPAKVIVVERPAQGSATIPGKDEAATAAALSGTSAIVPRGSKASATATPEQLRADPHGTAIELRGSKASATAPPTAIVSRDEQLRSDPHGTGISLRNP